MTSDSWQEEPYNGDTSSILELPQMPRLYRRIGLKSTMIGLRKELSRCLPGISAEERRAIGDHVQRRTPIIAELEQSWTACVPSREHLEWASSLVALFEAVEPHVSEEQEAIDIVTRVTRTGVTFHLAGLFANLLCRPKSDKKGFVRRLFNTFLPQYGAPWRWNVLKSSNGDRVIEIRVCFYHEFMSIHGHPGLTRAVCDLHLMWIDRINGSKHGMTFDRGSMTTMGYGDVLCRLPFVKVTTSAGNPPDGPTS